MVSPNRQPVVDSTAGILFGNGTTEINLWSNGDSTYSFWSETGGSYNVEATSTYDGAALVGDNVQLSTGANFASANAGTGITVTATSAVLTGSDAGDYDLISVAPTTATIAQTTASIVVTPTSGLIYNGSPQVTATGTATGVGGVNLTRMQSVSLQRGDLPNSRPA